MQYLLMIYTDEAADARKTPAEQGAEMAAYHAFTDEVKNAGVYLGGNPLHPTETATTVRVRNGKMLTTDGPFAETKEQLGGYYLLDCANLDEAIKWAGKIPSARDGSIEVRPILDFSRSETTWRGQETGIPVRR